MEPSVLDLMFPSNPSPQASGNPSELEGDRLEEPEDMEDIKETRLSKPSRTEAHMTHRGRGSMHRACTGLHQMGSKR